MKCVPLKVDRKLYKAILFVRFSTVKCKLTFSRSPRNTLSNPVLRSKRFRGAMRGGFVSGLAVPGAGMRTSVAPRLAGLQLLIGLVRVANVLPQNNPIAVC